MYNKCVLSSLIFFFAKMNDYQTFLPYFTEDTYSNVIQCNSSLCTKKCCQAHLEQESLHYITTLKDYNNPQVMIPVH